MSKPSDVSARKLPPARAWLLLAMLLFGGFAIWNQQKYQFDDAFISYRYAANLASGHGLVFNIGERVEGYSNFLWVLVLAVGNKLGITPELAAPILGVIFYLAVLASCWTFLWFRESFWGSPATRHQKTIGTILLVTLVTAHGLAQSAGSGLETSFFSFLILVGGLGIATVKLERVSSLLLFGCLPPTLFLTRPDGVIPGMVIIFLVAFLSWRDSQSIRGGIRNGLIASMPALIVGTGYVFFKYRYFGELLPNSYFAKGAEAFQFEAGFTYFAGFLGTYPHLLLGVPFLFGLALTTRSDPPAKRFLLYAVFVSLLYSGFLAKVGGDFMEYRLALHFLPTLSFAIVLALTGLMAEKPKQAVGIGIMMVGLSLLPPVLESKFYMQNLEEMNRYREEGHRVGLGLRGLPKETRVATTLIGTTGYFSELYIIDQWGLIDSEVRFREPRKPFVRGHLRFTNLGEVYQSGGHLYLEHPHLCRCEPACINNPNEILISTVEDECVRALVLNRDPELISHICSDSQRYPVIGESICGAQPPAFGIR